MVNVLGVIALVIGGLGTMALVAVLASAGRSYLQPDSPENYYGGVAAVLLVVAGAVYVLAPAPTTAMGLVGMFGYSLLFAMAVLYVALAVYLARGGGDGGQERDRGGDHDRPLLQDR